MLYFLWDLVGSLATLALTALNETSACLHLLRSLEWISSSTAGSQLGSITTAKILQELWERSPPSYSLLPD